MWSLPQSAALTVATAAQLGRLSGASLSSAQGAANAARGHTSCSRPTRRILAHLSLDARAKNSAKPRSALDQHGHEYSHRGNYLRGSRKAYAGPPLGASGEQPSRVFRRYAKARIVGFRKTESEFRFLSNLV